MAAREPNGYIICKAYDLEVDPVLAKRLDPVMMIDDERKCHIWGYWWRGCPRASDCGYPLTGDEAREALAVG